MPYICDGHDGKPADVLITNLGNGDVAALCGDICLPAWAEAMHVALSAEAPETADGGTVDPGTGDEDTGIESDAPVVGDPTQPPLTVPEAAPEFDPDADPADDDPAVGPMSPAPDGADVHDAQVKLTAVS